MVKISKNYRINFFMNNPLFKFFSFSDVEPGDYSIMDDCKNAIFIFATKKIKINKNQ